MEEREGVILLRLARVIPECEAWLYENPEALTRVRAGLADARKGKFAKGPDPARARRIADEIKDS